MPALGLMVEGQLGLTWERWARLLDAAENLGFDSVFRSDHYTTGAPQESLETFISLAYAADHTRRIEFGSLVAPVTFRQPALTAKMGAQIDDLSNGLPYLEWTQFDTRERGLHEPVDCVLRLYHVHAGLLVGRSLEATCRALEQRLRQWHP